MAKGKYQYWLTKEGLTLLEGWAMDGLTDEQIARNMGITPSTLYSGKSKYSEISESLKKGKEIADYQVENALFKKAIGFAKLNKSEAVPCEVIPFNLAKSENAPENKWVHFFIDDYQFERVWNFPKRYIDMFKRFEGVFTPDFSMLDTMPKAQRIWNCYRNRAIGYYLQNNGVNIIPTAGWAEYTDLDWCLDGLPIDSTIAIETYGSAKTAKGRYGLINGLERLEIELMPKTLVVYGKEIKSVNSMFRNVVWLDNYCKTIKSRV